MNSKSSTDDDDDDVDDEDGERVNEGDGESDKPTELHADNGTMVALLLASGADDGCCCCCCCCGSDSLVYAGSCHALDLVLWSADRAVEYWNFSLLVI